MATSTARLAKKLHCKPVLSGNINYVTIVVDGEQAHFILGLYSLPNLLSVIEDSTLDFVHNMQLQ